MSKKKKAAGSAHLSSTLPFHLKSTEDCKSDKAQNSEEFTKTAAPQIPQKKKMRKIVDEFNRYFGDGTLENWQRLCKDIGIEDDLPSVKQCRLALKKVWVNIYDLIDAVNEGNLPHRFPNQQALSKYTIATRKIFPKKRAKEGGPVKALLENIFS